MAESNSLTCASFNFEGNALRTVLIDGDPWFVAADVCAALELGNTAMAVKRLDDDEKGVSSIDTLGGEQEVTVVNESGLYSLILGSRKPEAKKFKKWVTGEVLPSIRKTGAYGVQPPKFNIPQTLGEALRLAADLSEKNVVLEQQMSIAGPKAKGFDRIASSDGSFCLTDAAKSLQVQPRRFMAKLQQMGWIYRRPMGSGWLAYQDRIAMGVMEHKVTTGDKSDGTEWTGTQVRVTAKGMARLSMIFNEGVLL